MWDYFAGYRAAPQGLALLRRTDVSFALDDFFFALRIQKKEALEKSSTSHISAHQLKSRCMTGVAANLASIRLPMNHFSFCYCILAVRKIA